MTTLTYFDIRGLAERARYLFVLAGAEYSDKRLSLTFGVPGDFSTISRPEFDAAKAAGELDVNMGKVPILEVDGFKIPQSKAIERYVAKKYGLMGSTDLEAALIDGIQEHQRDINDAYRKAKTDEKLEEYLGTTLGESLAKVAKAVGDNAGPFLMGEKPSYADVCFYVMLCENIDDKEKAKAAYESVPKFKAAIEAFAALDSIKAYQAQRKVTPF
eukprot:CAMPEP_0118889308 /NCGR_PEP_ID=MMETSP1166-20130328/293_1 /TAXON_ID=1104430 /ORGANISM="Chrysoreinhardia sp, Strain CCMP3193" /LENGTH=214 /DNA_ID=CAMNT_0006827895 /DNA_START=64 /DNA_END=708 /DNA_ORIENTATION=-